MKSLTPLGWKIHDSLKSHCPKMFAAPQANGNLMSTVNAMEVSVNHQLNALEDGGLRPHEAEETLRDQIYLPSEEDVPSLGETMHSYMD